MSEAMNKQNTVDFNERAKKILAQEPILSARDVEVTFSLRGKMLTAIRRTSLDLYEGETLAIVGESGSGKSVFTKCFVGMLDKNGSITHGSILYDGKEGFIYRPVSAETLKNTRGHSWESSVDVPVVLLEHIPNVIPVVGIVSKKFSEENDHLGTDFSAQSGDPVFASGSGIVEFAGQKDELGNTVVIDHQNGYVTSYSHLKDIRTRKGRSIGKGEIIGTVGNTGNSSAPHLHYSITKDGREMDPEDFINY